MYIPNDDTQNYPFFKLQLAIQTYQLNKPANQNSIKVPKVVEPTNKKTLGTREIHGPISPPSLAKTPLAPLTEKKHKKIVTLNLI